MTTKKKAAKPFTPNDYPKEIRGLMIRAARRHLRMYQIDFGELIYAGRYSIQQWESGKYTCKGPAWGLFLQKMESMGIKFDNKGNLIAEKVLSKAG